MHTSPTWGGCTMTLCCSQWAAPTQPWWSGPGSLWGPRRASWWTARSRTPTWKRMEVSPHLPRASCADCTSHHLPSWATANQLAPQSLFVVWGYDSDVAREKAIDYTTKIYAVSIREMEGTKPHQQLKEVSVEERYGVARFACFYIWWQETCLNQSAFSLPSKLLLKSFINLHRVFTCTQA